MYTQRDLERFEEADKNGEPVDWESIAEDLAEARAHRDYDR